MRRFWMVLGIAIFGGCLVPAEMVQERLLPSEAPAVSLQPVDAPPWDLGGHKGKTIVLDVMAVDCPPCRLQAPLLRELAERQDPSRFSMVSIDVGSAFPGWGAEDENALREYHEEHDLTWPIAPDDNSTVLRDYRVMVLPTLVIIRPDGSIHKTLLGERGLDEIEAAVREAGEGLA